MAAFKLDRIVRIKADNVCYIWRHIRVLWPPTNVSPVWEYQETSPPQNNLVCFGASPKTLPLAPKRSYLAVFRHTPVSKHSLGTINCYWGIANLSSVSKIYKFMRYVGLVAYNKSLPCHFFFFFFIIFTLPVPPMYHHYLAKDACISSLSCQHCLCIISTLWKFLLCHHCLANVAFLSSLAWQNFLCIVTTLPKCPLYHHCLANISFVSISITLPTMSL